MYISMAWRTWGILRISLTAVAIIDFNRSVRAKGAGHIFHGIVGTTSYHRNVLLYLRLVSVGCIINVRMIFIIIMECTMPSSDLLGRQVGSPNNNFSGVH
jgi:vacuolar-type H+-ATPase subunit I/STV1